MQKFRNRSKGIAEMRRSRSVMGFAGGGAHLEVDVEKACFKTALLRAVYGVESAQRPFWQSPKLDSRKTVRAHDRIRIKICCLN
jgi:hypothetical protein